jgi:multidrug efflux pump subunit AcrA (membrane-fusion protein)
MLLLLLSILALWALGLALVVAVCAGAGRGDRGWPQAAAAERPDSPPGAQAAWQQPRRVPARVPAS